MSWIQQPNFNQIDSLKHFINSHPFYCTAFLKLEEQLLDVDRIDEIKNFFKRYKENSLHFHNAQWILARYYCYKENYSRALACYKNAVCSEKIHFTLLFDYISVIHHNLVEQDVQQYLKTLTLTPAESEILQGYESLLACDYKNAINLLQKHYPFSDISIHCQYYRAYYNSGDIERALQIAEQGYKIAQKVYDKYYENLFFLSILKCKSWLVGHEQVQDDLISIQVQLEQTGSKLLLINLLKFKGDLANAAVDYENAISFYYEAAYGFQKFFDLQRAARAYFNISEEYYLTYRNTLSLQAAEKSLATLKKYKNYEIIARINQIYGKIYRELCLYELSEKYLEKASSNAMKSNNPYVLWNIDDKIQELRAVQAPPREAVQIYKAWIKKRVEENYTANLYFPVFSQAMILEELGDYDQALHYYQNALELARDNKNDEQIAWALAGIAVVSLQCGETSSAFALFEESLAIAHTNNTFQLIARIHLMLGMYYEKINQLDEAIRCYHEVIRQYENKRVDLKASELAIGFLSNRQDAYERLSECYYKKYQINRADTTYNNLFQCEELTHARALKEAITSSHDQSRHVDYASGNFIRLYQEFQNIQLQLRKQRKNISRTTLDSLLSKLQLYKYDIISEKIRLGHTTDKSAHNNSHPPLAAVQKKLAGQTALLYHITDRMSYVLILQADSSTILPLNIKRTEIDSLIYALMQPFHNVDTETILDTPFEAAIAHRLYGTLFKPIEQHCQLDSQILIIPSFSLAHLPFDMLLFEQPRQARYSPRQKPDYTDIFLGQRYAFYYSPTTHLLLREPVKCSPKMLIVANPFTKKDEPREKEFTLRLRTGWRFDPLVFAEQEASAIKRFCRQAKVFNRGDATEARIKKMASQYSILHIASHAFVDSTFDIFSGLALAEDKRKNNDGLLMGFEIANSDFSCDLVTLSACETGRGKLINGEGVLGLPRQFLASGTRSIIMSGWKVDDEFTADFMPRFYKNYIEMGFSKVQALNMAKRDVMNSKKKEKVYFYRHPFFWAAFNLYGDAGSSQNPQLLNRTSSTTTLLTLVGLAFFGFTLALFFIWRRKMRSLS
ncbi:CHAT domain-containing protein [candidate division KSB1 bacterium]|nr:CHAT domain-containing protein [candidate division KSB1 bacterium]